MRSSLWNFIFSQICWFACVVASGAWGYLWAGPFLTFLFAIQVTAFSSSPKKECLFLLTAALLGSVGDRLVVELGAYQFVSGFWAPWGYPLWMTSLWVAFVGMFDYALKWLEGRYALAALCGAVGGPMAYAAGAGLGAIQLASPEKISLLIIGLYWATVFPSLFSLKAYLEELPVPQR